MNATASSLRTLPDYLVPGLDLVLVGANPGITSAEQGHYYANPRNPFWKLLHQAGLVDEALGPDDDARVNDFGIGLTDLVKRPTSGINDLSTSERRSGAPALLEKLEACQPRVVCFNGKEVFRGYSGQSCQLGEQRDRIAGARVFVVPSTSPRNARWSFDEKLDYFRQLRRLVDQERRRA